jgi:cobalt-zinc-cadmium efflux system outer membrane protein
MSRNIFQYASLRWLIAVMVTGISGAIHLSSAAESPPANTNAPITATNQITLDALVADVLEKNPELNFYRAEIIVAKGERRTAGTLANPELAGTLGEKRVRGSGINGDGAVWSASVRQPFEWPGRIPLRKAIANQQIKLAELGFAQFKAALSARTRMLALNLFGAQEKAAATREVADRFQSLREVLVQRDPAGLTPTLETRIIEATELTLHRRASEAATAEQAALLELNQLRGQPWTETVKVQRPSVTLPPAPNMDSLLAAALTNNFELQMRRVELEQQGFKVSLAKNEQNPAFSVGPYVSQEHTGDHETQIGLGVTVPLPLWNRNRGSIETAEARHQQAATSLLVTQRQIERQVAEQAMRYQAKLTEIGKWRPDSVEKFQEAAALADKHYRLGAVPIATYVELQKQYLEAVEALLDTKTEALEAGQQLELLTGVPFPLTTTNAEPAKP